MKVFCLEDNPLVVLDLEIMIEDAGHEFVGAAAGFSEARPLWDDTAPDLVFIDIDLADGKTGVDAARWLGERGIAGCFVTGQTEIANAHRDLVVDIVAKPVDPGAIERVLDLVQKYN
ncbi:response regulator [Notoacmeibacter sp. MSK16QG-6]|uniref:response regulator n=1 Tax=Notoacmeibacter sp. MSK16QG-6 TaxID=2957982 RepID=UPI0020A0D464|nr:response regulator [Notoacmeibacter sp. MSK16QG-6]MCP1200853.1 response regulator [Notoacmeibacter sp. MSK16QG-6]